MMTPEPRLIGWLLAASVAAAAPTLANERESRPREEREASLSPDAPAPAAVPAGKIRCVNLAGTGGCYKTIPAAADAANDCDTITVAPGVYYENVSLRKGGLTLQGANKLTTIIDASSNSAIAVEHTGPGISLLNSVQKVRNLTVRNGATSAVEVSGLASTIQGLLIQGSGCDGILVHDVNGTQILNNEFRSVGCHAVVTGDAGSTIVKFNSLYGSGGDGFAINGTSNTTSNNKAYRCGGNCISASGVSPQVQSNVIVGAGCGGVFLHEANSPLVANNTIQDTECDAILVNGGGATVKHNVVANVDVGIVANGAGAIVTNNIITNAFGGDGILVNGDDAKVSNNVVAHVAGDGLVVEGSSATVASNTVSNTSEGIFVGGTSLTVELNKVSSVVAAGVKISCAPGCTGSTVAHNSVTDTFGERGEAPAFALGTDAIGLTVSNNVVSRPAGIGFVLNGVKIALDHNTVIDQGSNATESCFLVAGDGGHTLSFNTATRCSENGFAIRSSNNSLTHNTVNTSYGNGFEIAPGDEGGFNSLVSNTSIGAIGAGFAVISGTGNELTSNVALVGNRAGFCDDAVDTTQDANKFASVAPTCDIQR